MRAPAPRSVLLNLSSTHPRTSRVYALLFDLRRGARWWGRAESFSSSSSASSPSGYHSHFRHHDEESKAVKVAVWWDFENCAIPVGVNVFLVPHRIAAALRFHGIRGPVSITAFGDVSQLSRSTQDALYTSGVCLNHVPNCGKNSSDRSLLADLVYWVARNPPPVHFFLISGDRDFANILHRLRMNNYNILLACMDGASGALCSATTIMWQWNRLVKGDSLTGRYFNHPPDGLQGSWYGHYRGALDNAFQDSEEAISQQPGESMESVSDAKPRQIPKQLVNKIRQILAMYPEGISLTNLRVELKRDNVVLDKDYFGHKKFSQLLLSMPNILKFNFNPGDAQPLVYGVHQRLMDPIDSGPKAHFGLGYNSGHKEKVQAVENDANRKQLPPSYPAVENNSHKAGASTLPIPSDNGMSTTDISVPSKEQSSDHEETMVVAVGKHENARAQPSDSQSTQIGKENADSSGGLVGRICKRLFGSRVLTEESRNSSQRSMTAPTIVPLSVKSCINPQGISLKEKVTVPSFPSGDQTLLNADAEMENKFRPLQGQPISTENVLNASKTAPREQSAGTCLNQDDANVNPSLFSRIYKLCRFWRTSNACSEPAFQKNVNDSAEAPQKSSEGPQLDTHAVNGPNLSHIQKKYETHDLFSASHFWDSLESFLRSSKGADLVSKSSTWNELTTGLQKEGPLVLTVLNEKHLHHLVNLLIMDKKWLKESAFQASPFQLTLAAKRMCVPSQASGMNGLRTIFSNRTSHHSEVLSKHDTPNKDEQPSERSSTGCIDTKNPRDVLELKVWFRKTCNNKGCISSTQFEEHFERTFGRKPDCSLFGHFTLDDLVSACTADAHDYTKGKKLSRETTLFHCRNLLMDFLKHHPQGFNIGLFKPMFLRRYGYVLDYQSLGYPKLAALLQIMPGVRIESTIVLPAALHPDSEREKSIADEGYTNTYKLQNGKSREDNVSNDDQWEELGPLAGVEDGKQAMEEKDMGKSAMSEKEFSNPEECPQVNCGLISGVRDTNNATSAFLEVLDNYYRKRGSEDAEKDEERPDPMDAEEEERKVKDCKEGTENCQSQHVDGLVDCSRGKDVAVEPKHLGFLMPKLKSRKHYSFVSD